MMPKPPRKLRSPRVGVSIRHFAHSTATSGAAIRRRMAGGRQTPVEPAFDLVAGHPGDGRGIVPVRQGEHCGGDLHGPDCSPAPPASPCALRQAAIWSVPWSDLGTRVEDGAEPRRSRLRRQRRRAQVQSSRSDERHRRGHAGGIGRRHPRDSGSEQRRTMPGDHRWSGVDSAPGRISPTGAVQSRAPADRSARPTIRCCSRFATSTCPSSPPSTVPPRA